MERTAQEETYQWQPGDQQWPRNRWWNFGGRRLTAHAGHVEGGGEDEATAGRQPHTGQQLMTQHRWSCRHANPAQSTQRPCHHDGLSKSLNALSYSQGWCWTCSKSFPGQELPWWRERWALYGQQSNGVFPHLAWNVPDSGRKNSQHITSKEQNLWLMLVYAFKPQSYSGWLLH